MCRLSLQAMVLFGALLVAGCSQGDPTGNDGGDGGDLGPPSDGGPADAASGLGEGGLSDAAGMDGGATRTCMKDADCDPHDPCLSFACAGITTGEFHQGHCVYVPRSGCGPDAATARDAAIAPDAAIPPDASTLPDAGIVGLPPIDPACGNAPKCRSGLPASFPPFVPLAPPDVPGNCHNGFELGNVLDCSNGAAVYTVKTNQKNGSRAITLDIDFATYVEPDGMLVTGVDAQGKSYTLLNTCRLQTWNAPDPSGGKKRPPDQTIRQFRIAVKPGTTELTFNFGGVVSPMYLQTLGLCDFDLPPFAPVRWFQAVP